MRRRYPNARYYAEKLAIRVDDDLLRSVPLRLVDLIGDPHDVLCSIRAFTAAGVGEDGFGPAAETRSREHLLAFTRRMNRHFEIIAAEPAHGDHVIVRYEDLVTRLDDVARTLGTHLGVELDPAPVIAQREQYRHHMTSPSATASIGRWRRDLDPTEAEHLTSALEPFLREYGYL